MLRNPIYAGLIRIPEDADEQEELIKGLHEGIITEDLFYQAQSMLNVNKKSKNKPNANRKRDELPLRGNLICSSCGKNMTGSASKSLTGKRHFYYHCKYCHSERFRADIANAAVVATFEAMRFIESTETLFQAIVKEKILGLSKLPKESPELIKKKIVEMKKKIETAQDLLLDKSISSEDYKSMRSRYDTEVGNLELKLGEDVNKSSQTKKNIEECLNAIKNLDQLYLRANLETKQKNDKFDIPRKNNF